MIHSIGAITLFAALGFLVFAFRQGVKIKPEKRADERM
jgi:hypothetical protein